MGVSVGLWFEREGRVLLSLLSKYRFRCALTTFSTLFGFLLLRKKRVSQSRSCKGVVGT